MSAPAANNNSDHEPRGRNAVGRRKPSPYDSKPPKNELEFRDHHLRRATEDEATNRLYIRLRWHQTMMGLIYTIAALLPIVVIVAVSKWAELPDDQITRLALVATGGAGAGATATWLIRRRGRGTPAKEPMP